MQENKMDEEQLKYMVDAVSNAHPITILSNFIFIWFVISGLYFLFVDNKALYGVVIYVAVGIVVKLIMTGLLKMTLRAKFKAQIPNDIDKQ
ncbi:hypothetical protein [Shewanella aestuarii]|uniref:Uncharacterized protein n=1 Tax=Shewanella aestuarii TaxID=1028752 RepID=A0A6G9QPU7_9GAMM|nr:hypothetical protein [Shewanella aestuarii]QIR16614.1 hypothetical protein HBH39_19250 [Shewanella aestuarii]